MATIQIRDIPEEHYEALRRVARAEGKSLQAYMREEVVRMARHAGKFASLAAVDAAWERAAKPGLTVEEINAAIRELRGE